ncbi:Myb-binding protein 1A [Desmophyllum pertusum]|uniref:Myb-binding protein 1A n=1 Tax=Desmophyllum pertusum TaxID=174260 RepID=A0A9W9YTE2_9CNID|nr:Myb-binding protein 1A [Desmophyllum pertusum]
MPSENILSHFWELASTDETIRLKAASQLLYSLDQAQTQQDESRKEEEDSNDEDSCCDQLEYSVTRLVKGLASSRKGARQGFATVLTEVLSEFGSLSPERVLKLIAQNLEVTGSSKAWEERDCYIGQIFGMMSILRSQCEQDKISSLDTEWLGLLITRIMELSKKKSYLQELCAKVIVDIFTLVSTDVFLKCVYPSVKEIVESGWMSTTPEMLLISLALQRCWGDHIDKDVMKGGWKCSLIADKQNYQDMGTVLQDSISSHPRVHCVWDEISLALIGNPAGDFELFWNTVVQDGLFQSTHDRKFLGFQLVKKILPQISAKQVSVLFSGHMMRSFINSLSSSQSYLHEAGKQLASSLPALVNQNTDPGVPVLLLKQLLGRQGNMHFDKLTKTRTVDNLLGTLKGSGPKTFVAWLLDIFERGFVEDSTESE